MSYNIMDIPVEVARKDAYDLGIWASGYEARARWLITSPYCPTNVARWLRIEFLEGREVHSAPANLSLGRGELLGGAPGHRSWDGYWHGVWKSLIEEEYQRRKRPLDVFLDYSSLPRAVFGPLLRLALGELQTKVGALTLAYVPGDHAADRDGSQYIEGLRPLIGLDGCFEAEQEPAVVMGIGYDGVLAQAVIDLFEFGRFSLLYGSPGVTSQSVDRALSANRGVLSRADLVECCPAWSVGEAFFRFSSLCDWYLGRYNVLLVPLGPKPHILAAVLVAMANSAVGFRWVLTNGLHPVEVWVPEGATPFVTRVSSQRASAHRQSQ